ncbi:MAG: hypothetical protein E7575_03750 [Ruminococcaceae bacterium]|nr:hypothetical protein [Oscillospiraceae bacterium]
MKRIVSIALCAILCLSLFACKAENKGNAKDKETAPKAEDTTKPLVEKEYNDDGGYTTFDYNDEGKLIKSSTYDIEGNLTSYTETFYDENGNADKKVWYNADGEMIREMEI